MLAGLQLLRCTQYESASLQTRSTVPAFHCSHIIRAQVFPWLRIDKSQPNVIKQLTTWAGPDFKVDDIVFTSIKLSGQFFSKAHVTEKVKIHEEIEWFTAVGVAFSFQYWTLVLLFGCGMKRRWLKMPCLGCEPVCLAECLMWINYSHFQGGKISYVSILICFLVLFLDVVWLVRLDKVLRWHLMDEVLGLHIQITSPLSWNQRQNGITELQLICCPWWAYVVKFLWVYWECS